jgi:hypothetical protein
MTGHIWLVRRLAGSVLALVAALGLAVGGFWGYMKAAGGEVDICDGPSCTSAWYYVVPTLLIALLVGVIGVALLRGERRG